MRVAPVGSTLAVTYSLSREDLVGYARYVTRLIVRTSAFILVFVAIVSSLGHHPSHTKVSTAALLIANLIVSVILPILLVFLLQHYAIPYWYALKYERETRTFDSDIRLILSREGARYCGVDDEGVHRWRVFRSVVQTRSAIYLLWKGRAGWIIPLRAFASHDDAANFIDFARYFGTHSGNA
jgi:hypothetical protein